MARGHLLLVQLKHIFTHLKEWNRNRDATCCGDYVLSLVFNKRCHTFNTSNGIFLFWPLRSATCWLSPTPDMLHKVCLFEYRYLNWAIYWFWLIDHQKNTFFKNSHIYENDTEKMTANDVKSSSINFLLKLVTLLSIAVKLFQLLSNIQIALRCIFRFKLSNRTFQINNDAVYSAYFFSLFFMQL